MNKTYEQAQRLIKKNALKELEKMINKGFNVNTQSPWGLTLLHEACVEDKNEVVEFLLKNGAEVDIKTFFGESTPLMIAIRKNNSKVVSMLLRNIKNNEKDKSDVIENLLAEADNYDMKILIENFLKSHQYSDTTIAIH